MSATRVRFPICPPVMVPRLHAWCYFGWCPQNRAEPCQNRPVEPDTIEEEASAIRQARARLAIDRIREHARKTGLDKMTMDDIDALIAKVRRERGTRK